MPLFAFRVKRFVWVSHQDPTKTRRVTSDPPTKGAVESKTTHVGQYLTKVRGPLHGSTEPPVYPCESRNPPESGSGSERRHQCHT